MAGILAEERIQGLVSVVAYIEYRSPESNENSDSVIMSLSRLRIIQTAQKFRARNQ